MGINERREREKEERRKAILDCAKGLILTQGVHNVSMEEIAKKAELSKATVYLYFPGKEAIFNEICEDSARVFLDHIKSYLKNNLTGTDAIKCIWRAYVEIFGSTEDMIIVFIVRNYLYPGQPFIVKNNEKSPYVNAILEMIHNVINQCKDEGIFDSDLNSDQATQLLLTLFSNSVDRAIHVPPEERESAAFINGIKDTFQRIIYGFAKEGISRSQLDIFAG